MPNADGEQQETQHWIETAFDCGYIDQQKANVRTEKCAEIGRIIAGMISKSELFCGEVPKQIREQTASYFLKVDNEN